MIEEGAQAWKRLGGATALARLGVVDSPALAAAMERLFKDRPWREVFRIWDVLTLETWVRPRR